MAQTWTFGQKLGAGFAVTVLCSVLTSSIAYYAIYDLSRSKDKVIEVNDQDIENAERLRLAAERELSSVRAYILNHAENQPGEYGFGFKAEAAGFLNLLSESARKSGERREAEIVQSIGVTLEAYFASVAKLAAQRKPDASTQAAYAAVEKQVMDARAAFDKEALSYIDLQGAILKSAMDLSNQEASTLKTLVIVISIIAIAAAVIIGTVLTRNLTNQVGGAVQHIQSASTELQAAANQQATGSQEQATSMSEISTTISELLATSRQIAESAQGVARIAQETSAAARSGDQTVQRSVEMTTALRRQVDQIVSHMLDLGKKSQQIGSILEIIDELAEQTNILSINATIEAAGAGESGKRFSVVADEIRKLADRVGTSSKEIRTLIDEIRAAVNTSVMATETGSKTVDAASRQFNEVAGALKHIGGLVGTTTEAAREIELSTKQQATAVEQVNVAISNVAQATKETETSARQTLKTASILTTLSGDLSKIISRAA